MDMAFNLQCETIVNSFGVEEEPIQNARDGALAVGTFSCGRP